MLRVLLCVACAALGACERSRDATTDDDRPGPVPVPEEPVAGEPALLLVAPDADDTRILVQLLPGGEPRPVALEGIDRISSVAVAADGSGGAWIGFAHGNARLGRWSRDDRSLRGTEAPAGLPVVRAVSRDADTIVLEARTSLRIVTRGGAERVVETADLGTLMYGVDLALDGGALAFSTMQTDCSKDIATMGTCPVTLYALDLRSQDSSPRRLAGGDHPGAVAYDPQLDPSGDRLTYMTNAGDDSAACRKHVNQCRYAVHRIRVDGSDDQVLLDHAVIARTAGDTVTFRRRNGDAWIDQTLFVSRAGEQPRSLGPTDLRAHSLSPDGRRVAVIRRRDGQRRLEILDTGTGKPIGPGTDATTVQLIGWTRPPLPTRDAAAD